MIYSIFAGCMFYFLSVKEEEEKEKLGFWTKLNAAVLWPAALFDMLYEITKSLKKLSEK